MALGGALVAQFKLKADEDRLGQWMAHYLAEKLVAHKNAVGETKAALETELIDLILKFWKHRAYFPRGTRPFENYEPVLRALESLDPDQSDGRYFQHHFFEEQPNIAKTAAQPWIDVAKAFDRGARALINFCIRHAARACDKPDDIWLSAAKVLAENSDRDLFVIKIITDRTKEDDKEIDLIEFEINRAKKIREDLQKLLSAGDAVLETISRGLEALEAASGKSMTVSSTGAAPSSKTASKKKRTTKSSSRKKPRKKVSKARAPSRRKANR